MPNVQQNQHFNPRRCSDFHDRKHYHWRGFLSFMHGNFIHGESYPAGRTKEYRSRESFLRRCYNEHDKWYRRYGGRGIVVCKRWRESYADFLADMGRCPEGSTIHRINNDGNYSCGQCEECVANNWPKNCVWETRQTQARNRSTSRMVTIGSETKTLVEWCALFGCPVTTAWNRLKKGVPPSAAFIRNSI